LATANTTTTETWNHMTSTPCLYSVIGHVKTNIVILCCFCARIECMLNGIQVILYGISVHLCDQWFCLWFIVPLTLLGWITYQNHCQLLLILHVHAN
jgi:hypothetical protein